MTQLLGHRPQLTAQLPETKLRGPALLDNPRLSKGHAFGAAERSVKSRSASAPPASVLRLSLMSSRAPHPVYHRGLTPPVCAARDLPSL